MYTGSYKFYSEEVHPELDALPKDILFHITTTIEMFQLFGTPEGHGVPIRLEELRALSDPRFQMLLCGLYDLCIREWRQREKNDSPLEEKDLSIDDLNRMVCEVKCSRMYQLFCLDRDGVSNFDDYMNEYAVVSFLHEFVSGVIAVERAKKTQ